MRNAPAAASQWIWGLHSLEACLENYPELITELFFEKEEASLSKLAREAGLKIQQVKAMPRELSEKRTQGVAAKLKKFPIKFWTDELDALERDLGEPGHWAVLDGVEDPRNYGAILRSAAAFGVRGVFVAERDQCPLTGVVAQASAGNLFRVPIIACPNLTKVMDLCERLDVSTCALDGNGKALSEVVAQVNTAASFVWIVGAEGRGVRKGLLDKARFSARIPMQAGVESLNASVAASIAFFATYNATR